MNFLKGFGIYYSDLNNQIQCINYDCIFNGSNSATAVVYCFRHLRTKEFYKRIENVILHDLTNKKKGLIVWTDTGTHFRCAELAFYLLEELKQERVPVNWNFFVEKHGKNQRDQHFSAISNFISMESLVQKLKCSKDIADAINKRSKMANENRQLKSNFNYFIMFVL